MEVVFVRLRCTGASPEVYDCPYVSQFGVLVADQASKFTQPQSSAKAQVF